MATPTTPVDTAAPTGREAPAWIYKLLNPIVKAMLRSPLHGGASKQVFILQFTGRKSGKQYTTPVSYNQVGDMVYFDTNARWYKNIGIDTPVIAWIRSKQHAATATVINAPESMKEAYSIFLPQSARYAKILGIRVDDQGDVNAQDVARVISEGHVVIRVHLLK